MGVAPMRVFIGGEPVSRRERGVPRRVFPPVIISPQPICGN